jgi:hypothetical protein
MTRSRYRIFEDFRPHFCTCTNVGWLPIFTWTEAVEIVLDSWKYLIDHDRLTIYGYVILEKQSAEPVRSHAERGNELTKEPGHQLPQKNSRILGPVTRIMARFFAQIAMDIYGGKNDAQNHPKQIARR